LEIKDLTDSFCTKHKKWVQQFARKSFKKYPKNPRWDAEELESECWIGFVEAWKKYDPTYGVPFKIYARRQMLSHILKFVSSNMFTLKCRYDNVQNDKEKLDQIHHLEVNSIRLDTNAESAGHNAKESTRGFSERVPTSGVDLFGTICKREERGIVNEEIKKLRPIEQKILRLRYFGEETLEQIGKEVGYSGENVRLILKEAESKLKQRLEYL